MRRRHASMMVKRLRLPAARAYTSVSTGWRIVDRLNQTVEEYPASSFAAHISSSLGTFGVAYLALSAVGFDAPSLAVAGIVTRLTKKLRTPPELTLAAALAHAFPAAKALKLGPLLTAPMAAAQAVPPEELSRVEKGILRAVDAVQGPVNTYGGPYIIVRANACACDGFDEADRARRALACRVRSTGSSG